MTCSILVGLNETFVEKDAAATVDLPPAAETAISPAVEDSLLFARRVRVRYRS